MRIRLRFAKTGYMRYTGHLDLHRTWERTLRRAGLPLAYSQGFAPHPRINLACALPLGFTSQDEIVDFWLEHDLPVDAVESALQTAAPPGVEILATWVVDDRAPTLQTILEAADYIITFLEPLTDLELKCQTVLTASSLPRHWRDKPYDLRPLILEMALIPPNASGLQQISARLKTREGATGRPEEVVAALGGTPTAARVHRQGLIFRENIAEPEA